ncbi:von Willebrand factor D and EGF domain-containing protein-like [Saccostrea cucullata]|uniref:von Willebrand factor D and EGF domain-containing protein-like n=1 Tax=Saccostrea cuccullata TaxID=36930 RepID=UPI002ED36BB0
MKITGITELAKIHLEEILQTCSAFILVNSTFQEENPEVTYEIQTLCPWNCSGNGICNSGNCTCYTGYAGSDCSFDLSAPPTITHISDFGFCDKSKENCDEITVYGKYFLENMNTFCYMTRLMYNVDGASLATESYQIGLQERTLFEGFCPLQYSSLRPWVTFFQFNISNDDKSFTKTFNVYTFQSLCQEYQNNSGDIYYTFKDGFCFIDGSCVIDGETNPKNLCDICSVANNRYRWTLNEGLCQIDGVCFARGEVQGTNFCRFCNPSSSNSTWSLDNEFCFIRNRCYFRWEPRQLNSCEICDPDQDQSDWSLNKDCIPTSEVSTDSPTESVEPIIENTTILESTTKIPTTSTEATEPTWVTTYSTSEKKTSSASTSAHVSTTPRASTSALTSATPQTSTMAPIEVSSASLSETDIIAILCASGIAFAIVIAIACVVYRTRTLKKDSKTRWTIPNVKNTTKEIPGISLMKYTKK